MKGLASSGSSLSIRCMACKGYFTPRDTKSVCKECREAKDLQRICNLCDKTFFLTDHTLSWISVERVNTRCPVCITCEKYVCRCCGVSYIAPKIGEDEPSCMYKCEGCQTISSALFEDRFKSLVSLKLRRGRKLVITYLLEIESHDGWCSDPYDEEVVQGEVVCEYPLLDIVTEEHVQKVIDDLYHDNFSTEVSPINYYIRRYGPCGGGGSGYCGMKTTFHVKDVEIMKGEPDISKNNIEDEIFRLASK